VAQLSRSPCPRDPPRPSLRSSDDAFAIPASLLIWADSSRGGGGSCCSRCSNWCLSFVLLEATPIVEDFREWRPDAWFDRGFLQGVPAPALKALLRAIRPLSADLHERVHESLFAGIKKPFHYLQSTGWMRRLLRTGCALPEAASFDQRASYMREKLAWAPADVVLLVYHQPDTYATTWEGFLRYFRDDCINLDTMLVCHPGAREVVLFWEDHGPIFGKRGHRQLPQPRWDHGDATEDKVQPKGIAGREPAPDLRDF
jgi:hypothetical protein